MKSQNGVRIKTQLEHPIIGKDIFKKKKAQPDPNFGLFRGAHIMINKRRLR